MTSAYPRPTGALDAHAAMARRQHIGPILSASLKEARMEQVTDEQLTCEGCGERTSETYETDDMVLLCRACYDDCKKDAHDAAKDSE
jgi:hypothetical protein